MPTGLLLMYYGSSVKVGEVCRFGYIMHPIIYKFYFIPHYFLVIWSTVGVYLAIARIAYNQSRAIAALNQPYDTIEASMNKKTWKIVKTLGTILGTYIFCIMPQFFILTALLVDKELSSNPYIHVLMNFTVLFYWANTWINPIIYAWRIKEFRVAFKRLFPSFRAPNDVHPQIG